jgi:hypothetical protein
MYEHNVKRVPAFKRLIYLCLALHIQLQVTQLSLNNLSIYLFIIYFKQLIIIQANKSDADAAQNKKCIYDFGGNI